MSAAGPQVHMNAFVPEAPAPEPPADDGKPHPDAAERLAASRERMRQWMTHTDTRGAARRRVEAAKEAGDKPAWMDRLRTAPVVGVVLDAASAWWTNHPMQPAAQLAGGVVRETVAPLARRHPILVVATAFFIGVAVVRWRPWRWVVTPALFAGLGSQILTRLISSVPLDTLFDAIGSFAGRRTSDDVEGPAPAAPSGPPVPAAAMEHDTVTP